MNRIVHRIRDLKAPTEKKKPGPEPTWWDSEVKIEDNIPITPSVREVSSPFYEQVKTMQVGQSFLFPYTRQPICSNLARATGFKFTQRKVSALHMRIWRIE